MKPNKKVLTLIMAVCILITMIPANVLAVVSGTDTGQIFTTSNGDGFTAYKLRWDDASGGIVSFDTQKPIGDYWNEMVSTMFVVRIFRDGESIGTSSLQVTEGSQVNHGIVDISGYMEEPGTYFFTVYYTDMYNTEISHRSLISRSEAYTKTTSTPIATVEIGDPSNLRFEIDGNQVWCVWDAAPGFDPSQDQYVVNTISWYNENGVLLPGTGLESSTTETRYQLDLAEYDITAQDRFVKSGTSSGPYTFGVTINKYDKEQFQWRMICSTVAYDRAQGVISFGEISNGNPLAVYEILDGNQFLDGSPAALPQAGATPTTSETAVPSANINSVTATPTNSSVFIDGSSVTFDAYNINGNNYFKLRDLAIALNGSSVQFDVGWDGSKNAISLLTQQPYSGENEMQGKGNGQKPAVPTASQIFVDGTEVALTAYNIEGNNYFMLRELGDILGFNVDWDGASNSIMITTGGSGDTTYSEPTAINEYLNEVEWSADFFVDMINSFLVSDGYGRMIIDKNASQFAQEQVNMYASKNNEAGNVFGEGNTTGYFHILTYTYPKDLSPAWLLDDFQTSEMNNIHLLDEYNFYIGIGYGEMANYNIIHIIGLFDSL